MHIVYLLVQPHSSGGKFLKVSESVCEFLNIYFLTFCPQIYSTNIDTAKIKPQPTYCFSHGQGGFFPSFFLPYIDAKILDLHCHGSMKCLLPVLPSLFSLGKFVFTIFISYHRSREVLHSLWSHIRPLHLVSYLISMCV